MTPLPTQIAALSPDAGTCQQPALCRLRKAAFEAARLYEERTIKVAEDRADIYDLAAGTRVPWSEIRSRWLQPTPTTNVVDDRLNWQPIFEAALSRRGLRQVLKGKMTATAWLAKEQQRKRPRMVLS